MYQILLVINLIVVIIMIGLILLQRSEGGALGIGGGGGMMSNRGAGNALTKATGVLAAIFMLSALALTWITRQQLEPTSILDSAPATEQSGEAPSGQPAAPVIPLSE